MSDVSIANSINFFVDFVFVSPNNKVLIFSKDSKFYLDIQSHKIL